MQDTLQSPHFTDFGYGIHHTSAETCPAVCAFTEGTILNGKTFSGVFALCEDTGEPLEARNLLLDDPELLFWQWARNLLSLLEEDISLPNDYGPIGVPEEDATPEILSKFYESIQLRPGEWLEEISTGTIVSILLLDEEAPDTDELDDVHDLDVMRRYWTKGNPLHKFLDECENNMDYDNFPRSWWQQMLAVLCELRDRKEGFDPTDRERINTLIDYARSLK